VFDETVKLFRSTRPATITLDVENRLDQKRVINGDPNQIQEALLNLCNNAVQAMGEKGAMLVRLDRVTLERTDIPAQYACRPGAFARITVKDSGCGMDKDTMDKIFDPFFTTKKIGEGTGMGLSTVQGIVKNHHGVINVSSTVGKGSTFELCFPMTNEAPAMKKKTDDEELPGGKERILFIDDDETLVRLGEEMLTDLNYRVAVATDSKQALNRFTDDPSAFDLVITDQTMPGLTGKEIIAAMKKIRPTIRTVLLTGYNSSKINAAEAARAGIDAFCMKPLNMSELAKTVRRALNGKRIS
jgi:CheY-like chemotaxis protein